MHSYVIRMSLACTCMSSVCHSYALVCHPYVTHMYSYVTRVLLLWTRMSPVCHSYILVCHLVCHSYVLACQPYVIRMSLVCGFTMNPKILMMIICQLSAYFIVIISNDLYICNIVLCCCSRIIFTDF